MRVGVFTDAYEPHVSGVTTSISVLKETLEKMGHEVFIVTANLEDKGFKYDEKNKIISLAGIKTGIYETKLTGVYSKKAMEIIKTWNLDLIHCQTEFGVGAFSRIVSKKLGLPVVHTYHTLYEDYVYYVTHGYFDKLGKKIAIKITQYYCDKNCDELIVPTNKIKELFENKYNIKRTIHVIPTGIDIKKFNKTTKMTEEIKNIKKKYKINKTDFIIGSVGRIAKEKNLEELINHVDKLININKNIKLMIVGAGPYLDDLKALVKKLGINKNVIFTGNVDYDLIPAYYNTCDCIASFSTSETQGLTIIEGLAASRPTICINDPSFRDVIEDGFNGYLVNNYDEFENAIFKLMNNSDLYKTMANNAKNSTFRYSKEVFGSEILKVYHKAMKK